MSKTLVVMLATAVLASSLAFAAPRILSDSSLDTVAAGSSAFDAIFGGGATPITTGQLPADAAVADESAIAINGDLDTATLAHEAAVSGMDNTAVYGNRSVAARDTNTYNTFATGDFSVTFGAESYANGAALGDYSVALGSYNYYNAVATGDRSVAMGYDNDDNNTVTGDNSNGLYIEETADYSAVVTGNHNIVANFGDDLYEGSAAAVGEDNVVAGAYYNYVDTYSAGIYGNYNDTLAIFYNYDSQIVAGDCVTAEGSTIYVDISASFNVETNTVCVSGQNDVTAIVNANTLAFQGIGTNLTISNATATVATVQGSGALSVPIVSGNAIAASILEQANIGNSFIAAGDGNINVN